MAQLEMVEQSWAMYSLTADWRVVLSGKHALVGAKEGLAVVGALVGAKEGLVVVGASVGAKEGLVVVGASV